MTIYDTLEIPDRPSRDQLIAEAKEWLAQEPLFLDTETTGLRSIDQVCEIALIDYSGEVLMNQLIKPTVPIGSGAVDVHGISEAKVADAPTFGEINDTLHALMRDRTIIVYNLDFDWRILMQSAYAFDLAFVPTPPTKRFCAMNWYATYHGDWNDWSGNFRWQKLSIAAARHSIELPKDLHRAAADAALTRQLLMKICGIG